MKKFHALIFHRIVKDKKENWEDVNFFFFDDLISESLNKGQIISSLRESKQLNTDIVLTFDDGHLSDFQIVFPYLVEKKLSATFFIVPKYVSQPGYMSWNHIKKLSDNGMEIGSHSLNHANFSELNEEEALSEMIISKELIEKKLGKPITAFSFPYGSYKLMMEKLAYQAGYEYVCNSKPGKNNYYSSIIKRIAVHSGSKDFKKILSPNFYEIRKKYLSYYFRFCMKKLLGINYYMKIKGLFSR